MEKKAKSLFCSVVIAALVLTACQTGLACEDKGGGLKGAVVEFGAEKAWPFAKKVVLNRTFQVGAAGVAATSFGWWFGRRRGKKIGYDEGYDEACNTFTKEAKKLGVDKESLKSLDTNAIADAVYDSGYKKASRELVDKTVELGVDTKEKALFSSEKEGNNAFFNGELKNKVFLLKRKVLFLEKENQVLKKKKE